MKTTLANLISCLCFSFLLLNSALAEGSFEHNEGQLQYFDGTPASEILFYQQGNYDVYFKKTGISYIYKSKSSVNVTDKKAYEAFLNDSTFYYRLDLNFKGSNVDRLIGDHPKSDYTNYYSANAPDGILNVKSYEKILYENLYPNIDAVFYFKDGKLKYDFHVKPGGAIEDIQLEFVNEDDLEVVENQIIINTPLGAVKESIPVSFQFEGRKQKNVPVLYKKTKDIIQFAAEYDRSKELIIDPEIEWQTFYDGAWGVGTANRIDTRGDQFVMTFYSFKTGVPILNPGNGAYFQNTNAGSGDIVIVQFDTMGVRQWATYYGGSDYENTSDIEIDSKGRLVVSFVTESTDIPVENAGGYFDPSWTAGQFNWSSAFVIRFDKNGVRQWATHYDHFQYPQVQIDSDDNIWLAGQCQYDNPSTQSAPGAYLQTTIVPKASFNEGSGDYFICKFDSLTNRTWATILGGNCREMLGDFVIDNNDNAYLLGGGDNYYGTTFVTQNAGGYFDGALGQGTGGTSADRGDILIHKFSQNGALLWGTAFGGSGFEWAWPAASSISFDQNGNVYIASPTRSSDLPFVDLGNGAHYDNVFSNPTGSSNPSNHFIARFSPSTSLQWCTYWGQRSFEYSTWHGIELEFNSQNRLVLAVGAYSGGPHYPIVNRTGDYNASNNGNTNDVHIAEFDQNFAVDWATYYGGNADERLGDMVLSENGYSIFMTGTRPNFSGNTGVNWVLPLNNSIYFDSTWANSSSASGSSELITKFSNHNLCDPVFLTAAAASICESDSVLLTPNIGGGTYNILNGGGTIVGNYYFPANVSSTTTVSIEYALNSSPFCTDSKDTVDLTVFADPSLATIFNDTVCFGDTAILTILSPSGVTHNWYTGSVGGTPFHTGTSYQINGATIPSTFYIENVNSNGCKSDRVPVQVVINANPINPTTVNDTVCSGDSATLLVTNPSGVAFDWFSNPTGGTSLHVGGSLVINPANTSTTYYVESVTKDGCVSPGRTSVELVVNSRPNDPVGLNDTVCSGDNATLTLTSPAGVSFDWYTSQNGTSIVHTGSSLSINPATSSTSYYVESVNNSDCPSVNRIKLDLVVLALPQNVTALNDTVCSGDSATLIATNPNNVTFSWYANASGGTALGTGTNYVINPATANGTYYVEALNNSNCKSANRTPVQLVVLSTPTAPSTIDDTVCAGQSATLGINTSVGISYDWYDASSSGNLVNTGINYNINPATVSDTFYVNAVSNFGCGSASRSPVYLVVNALPQAPSGMGDT
ncbi:MAG: hypothetical protein MRY83_15940, partial [Flavobacteriales bacterium]|nr:hypothetical protein [Flavobacteriales bacterium]